MKVDQFETARARRLQDEAIRNLGKLFQWDSVRAAAGNDQSGRTRSSFTPGRRARRARGREARAARRVTRRNA